MELARLSGRRVGDVEFSPTRKDIIQIVENSDKYRNGLALTNVLGAHIGKDGV